MPDRTASWQDVDREPRVSAQPSGVGVATLYRCYPNREALLDALTHRIFELALAADARDETALACPSWWWDQVIDQRDRLVLPFGGGPPVTNTQTQAVQSQLHHSLHRLVERGQHEGSIRGDITTCDVIIFGAISCC